MIHSHRFSIAHNNSKPLAQYNTPWLTTTGSVEHTMIHNNWAQHSVSWFTSWWDMLSLVVVNHGVSSWTSCCEWCCVKLSQWLWIMMCYSEPVVVKHGLLCCAKCCESWCLMLSPLVVNHDALSWAKCLWIMIRYAEPSGCESWCAIPNQWLCIMVCYEHSNPCFTTTGSEYHIMIHNHWLSLTQHHSQQLVQLDTPWFTTTRLSISHHDSQSLAPHYTPWFTAIG
jgi:hypothetical protein